jgi:circadian clock protein KaiC
MLRCDRRRLFRWLKERKLTAFVTGERGAGALTRHGLENISDGELKLKNRQAGRTNWPTAAP